MDISDYSIEVISLGGSFQEPKLLAMGSTLLEKGIFTDGKILNKELLQKAITLAVKNPQFGKFKTKKFIFSLPESKSFLHISRLPANLRDEELPEFIKSQAEQTFPYRYQDLYCDYALQDEQAVVVAAPKNIVDDYLGVFKKCKLRAVALEVESISLARALLTQEAETVLIVDIGALFTNFSLFSQGNLESSDSLPVAGNRFSQALSEKLNISLTEADALKKKVGFNPEYSQGRVFLVLQKEIQPIIEEVKKINNYFREKTGKEIKKIIVAGGSNAMPHLIDYLKENLVENSLALADPWVKINIDILKKKEYYKKAMQVNPALYSTAIGSALRGLLKNPAKDGINLLPLKGRLFL